ncbi:fasciclin-like arabinogalactan protein 14 [Mercurialis annua]|uniref:fasciclin-like arabinogalactan protein 14 n=1 Tax=Mercurialis annua TaxID=3986 RepID=UPI00215E1787|nr:fasciclin-like arabinogalactan protein 14 [Mercurialis annua]
MSYSSFLALCFSFFLLFSAVTAFNITKILSNYSDFTTFNDILTKTQVASTINSRQTITILAVDNANISPLSTQSLDMQKTILSMHVILDYYDDAKLQKLPNKTELLTTLYQSSGQAVGDDGFLNATLMRNGDVVLGSAVSGSSLNSKLIKPLMTQPYNVSILHVSDIIMPRDINLSAKSTSAPPPSAGESPKSSPPSPSKAPAPAEAPKAAEAPAPAGSPQASDAPMGSSPEASTPSVAPSADTPEASSPSGMGPAAADSPFANGPAAADTPRPAAAAISIAGTGTRVAMFVMALHVVVTLAKLI